MSEYQNALDWLAELASERKFFHDKVAPSLDTTHKLLDALGRPDQTFDYRVIIGGTAGKGSTCRYLEQTLLNQGQTVALISSPHLQVVNERIRINGRLISRENFGKGVLHIQKISKAAQIKPTYYEAIVVAGIYLAAAARVKILICEVGIGGDMDAVNAVTGKRIAAVTFIGDDHLEMFGGKMENLATAKAGIFTKDSVLNISYEQKYSSIFNKVSFHKIKYIKGLKYKMNKKIARKICEQILGSIDFQMQNPKLPARWERVNKKLILDGAHSGPRFEYILPKIKKLKTPKTGIFAMSQNHDSQNFDIILNEFDQVIWTEFPGSIPARELQKLHNCGEGTSNIKEALSKSKEQNTLVTGSLYLCGHAREIYYPASAILDQQCEWPT